MLFDSIARIGLNLRRDINGQVPVGRCECVAWSVSYLAMLQYKKLLSCFKTGKQQKENLRYLVDALTD